MINVEAAVTDKFPRFTHRPAIIRKPTLSLLRRLAHEHQINDFLEAHKHAKNFEFIDKVFDFFDFSYYVKASERKNIPALGRVVIIANHPIGSLDGLALLRLISEIRKDVCIVANDMLSNIHSIQDLIIPVDNMTGASPRRTYKKVKQALENEEAVIVFPAGEVSRAHPTKGVRDNRWLPGFLNFARSTHSPILPIRIHAKNSLLFYGASMMYKPLGTALLAHEMFNKQSRSLHFSIGELIPYESLKSKNLHDRTLVKRLKQHLYTLGKRKYNPIFETEKAIAHPENAKAIQAELKNAELIGETRDGNRIYIARCTHASTLLNEIGRLREIAFRKVGEGTGRSSDIDIFDLHYLHLVLWDRENLEIAGAYRIGEGKEIMTERGITGFYTSTLYDFSPAFTPYLSESIELGRSFVNPKYWGKASLDYLWQGIGRYLARHPNVRYMIGPVSMSAHYPKALMAALAYFYQRYYSSEQKLASAHHPFVLAPSVVDDLNAEFNQISRDEAYELIQRKFQSFDQNLPVLFKQYTALFEDGGFQTLVFSVDPDFGDCLDGLCMCDVTKIKPAKRRRYIN